MMDSYDDPDYTQKLVNKVKARLQMHAIPQKVGFYKISRNSILMVLLILNFNNVIFEILVIRRANPG